MGGDEVKVLDSVYPLNFSVTRTGIYFATPTDDGPSIAFLSFQTGKITPITTAGARIQSGLSVSPDGRFLLYSFAELTAGDLMLAENFR